MDEEERQTARRETETQAEVDASSCKGLDWASITAERIAEHSIRAVLEPTWNSGRSLGRIETSTPIWKGELLILCRGLCDLTFRAIGCLNFLFTIAMNYDKVRGSPVFCPLTKLMIAARNLLVCDGSSARPKALMAWPLRAAVTNRQVSWAARIVRSFCAPWAAAGMARTCCSAYIWLGDDEHWNNETNRHPKIHPQLTAEQP